MTEATAPDMVREVILAHREQGLSRAFEIAGRLLGISARRARAFFHHEVQDPRLSECERITAGYETWAEQEMRRLAARQDLLAARRAALRSAHDELHGEIRALAASPLGCDRRLGPGQGRRRAA